MMGQRLQSPWMRGGVAAVKLAIVPVGVGFIILALLRQSPAVALSLSPGWLLAAVLCLEAALWLVSLRLVHILTIYEAPLSSLTALRINLQSMFYFLVVPTHAGMEAVRFLGLRAAAPAAGNAVIASTLVLDRLLGVLAAGVLFAGAAANILPERLQAFAPRLDIGLGLAGLAALALIAGTAAVFTLRRSQRVAAIVAPLRRSWGQLGLVLASAVLAQALVVGAVACGLRGLGMEAAPAALAFGIMGGTLFLMIPISVAGLGPAEIGGAALLIAAGMPEPAAVVSVFIAYLTRVLAGLQGAAIEVWDGGATLRRMARPPATPPRSMDGPA
jgi:hypothetical protein